MGVNEPLKSVRADPNFKNVNVEEMSEDSIKSDDDDKLNRSEAMLPGINESEIVVVEKKDEIQRHGWSGDFIENTDMETIRLTTKGKKTQHFFIVSGVEIGTKVQTIMVH